MKTEPAARFVRRSPVHTIPLAAGFALGVTVLGLWLLLGRQSAHAQTSEAGLRVAKTADTTRAFRMLGTGAREFRNAIPS